MKTPPIQLFFAILITSITVASFGQTVQLPTFRQFSSSGTVWVPDGGSALLSGSTFGRTSTQTSGVPAVVRAPLLGRAFTDRSVSTQRGWSSASVRAQIIDLQAMDEAILRAAATPPPAAAVRMPSRQPQATASDERPLPLWIKQLQAR